MAKAKTLADSHALLDNILFGKALPEHLAKKTASNAGTDSETTARVFRDAVAAEVAAKMDKSPLMAICYNHHCGCGATWQSFGFFARKVKQAIAGAGAAEFTKRLDYDPAPELPSSTEWQTVEEQYCLKCFGGAVVLPAANPGGPIGAVTALTTLCHMADRTASDVKDANEQSAAMIARQQESDRDAERNNG